MATRLIGWDDGSLFLPYGKEDRPTTWRGRRILIDLRDPYAPRRVYYFGVKYCLIVALERAGRTQIYDWTNRCWTRRAGWINAHPTHYE